MLSRRTILNLITCVAVLALPPLAMGQQPLPASTPQQLFSSANFQNRDLQGFEIPAKHFDLSGVDLQGFNIRDANLDHANLQNANLQRADLSSTTLRNADLTNANLRGALFFGADLRGVLGADFTDADIRRASLPVLTREQLEATQSYKDMNMLGIWLHPQTDLSGIDFNNQNLGWSFFNGTRVSDGSFREADLTSASFSSAELHRPDFSDSILTSAFFRDAELHGADFSRANLKDASFIGADLTGANLKGANVEGINLSGAKLTGANLEGMDLGSARHATADFEGANLTNANIVNVWFSNHGTLTLEQLQSTASYRNNNLHGIGLTGFDLRNWDFSNQDLSGADFSRAQLEGANFTDASIRRTMLHSLSAEQLVSTRSYRDKELDVLITLSDFSGVDFSGQNFQGSWIAWTEVNGADFTDAWINNSTINGLSRHQVESTASYKAKDLRGVDLWRNSDVRGWDFRGQDLRGADIGSRFAGADFTDAIISSANGMTEEQLKSTASYKAKDLSGVRLEHMRDWDLRGQNLTDAILGGSADLTDAIIQGATIEGPTEKEVASSASYKQKNLQGLVFRESVRGWDFSGQDLTDSIILQWSADTDFRGARLNGAQLGWSFSSSVFDSSTTIDQWTSFRNPAFDPVAAGLSLETTPLGDFDSDSDFDQEDLLRLQAEVLGRPVQIREFPIWRSRFDVNEDTFLDDRDVSAWLELAGLPLGDVNLDGNVSFVDFTTVSHNFGEEGNWLDGDLDSDGIVGFGDFLLVSSNYGQQSMAAQSVPEPSTQCLAWLLVAGIAAIKRNRIRGGNTASP